MASEPLAKECTMNRIDQAFAACRAENRKALVAFISAGDPDLDVTERLLHALTKAGADVIELGVPFSDPMADGPTIQAASQRALAAGTTLPKILEVARRFRERAATPLVLFSYYNLIFRYGVERLATQSAKAGIDGWLVVDLPAEESAEVRPALVRHGLHWIALAAPTTPAERLPLLLEGAGGFVYYITVTGVTGARNALPSNLVDHVACLKQATDLPVVAGFGISTPDMARKIAAHVDGVVVGSKIIDLLSGADTPAAGVERAAGFVHDLSTALRGG